MIAVALHPAKQAFVEKTQLAHLDYAKLATTGAALLFFAVTCAASYAHWTNYEYRTFDLAYYVQAISQLLHGHLEVTVEGVPLLGNHVEPIVFLFAPIFALAPHPLVFVLVQNALLATMAPTGYRIATRFGSSGRTACLLAIALLLAPASSYIALHEFHPEALAAPFLLLMLEAQLVRAPRAHCLWFVAALACKENIALLLIAYAVVSAALARKQGSNYLRTYYFAPAVVALLWFLFATLVVTPLFNRGEIDYLALYSRLGSSTSEIVRNIIFQPQLFLNALVTSITAGNLLPALLLPFLGLPLLRARWLLVTSPILAQHLLSWRSSEWTIYFHYATPLLPFFWFATVEWFFLSKKIGARLHLRFTCAIAVVVACLAAQCIFGPAGELFRTAKEWPSRSAEREARNELLSLIGPNASVVAPLPYLSHLAQREKLYSLHYILKGLKTLSCERYVAPAAPDYVLIDRHDTATFDQTAGYYHPVMRTMQGELVPSSDQLLSDFLAQADWTAIERGHLLLLSRVKPASSN